MWLAIFGLIGVLVGGTITMLTEYFIARQNTKLEKLKMSKEDDSKNLYNFLIPVIEIYEKSDLEKEILYPFNYEILGGGLDQKYIMDLRKVVKENKRYTPLELINKFNRVNGVYEIDVERYIAQEMYFLEEKGERPINYYYDNDKSFITDVKKEAEKIEKKYN